jgi:uncharacterized protein YkwD
VGAINDERRRHGLPELTPDPELGMACQRHADAMNVSERLYHAQLEPGQGEVVGQGAPSWSRMVDGWMASDDHAEIILGKYTRMGAASSGPYYCARFA